MHTLVRTDSPAWYMKADPKVPFAEDDRSNLESVFFSCQLELADNVSHVLDNDEPPPFSSLKSSLNPKSYYGPSTLSLYGRKVKKPALYIGSGTEQDVGVHDENTLIQAR
ncbi:hypothetical protein PV11_02117 [Exophiala sideris]|uniref:Uncharacterized protein n=1 Tax=Exophiala sideris TaxID=1016849 RepID=A0A0D1YVF4_9EURO|nr:hypothetical protein PV11_02117 [Exophiala sideris]